MDEPIRILNLFTVMDRGGAESMVMNYYRHIDRSKVQFDFMVHRTEHGAYDDEIESLGGKIFRMSAFSPKNYLRYMRELKAFFIAHPEYRIIHSHMSESGFFAFREAEKRQVPVRICHAHNAPKGFDWKLPFRLYFRKKIKPLTTDMFMCGQASGNWLFGAENASRFVFMPNAVDGKKLEFSAEIRAEVRRKYGVESKKVIGHVGRFHPQKNHPFILEVFKAFLEIEPKAVLWLVGDGNDKLAIQALAQEKGIADNVIFWGSRSDVTNLLQGMDAMLFPSLYEGLSMTLVEAQAAGLSCLISSCIPPECAITDLVTPLSLERPVEEWAQCLQELSNQPRRMMSEEIKKTGFDIETNAKWLEEFYLAKWKENQ